MRVWSERVHAVDRVGRGEDVCRQWGIIMHKKYDQQLRGLGVRIQGSSKRGFKGPRVQYARAQGSKNWCFKAPRVQWWVRVHGSKQGSNQCGRSRSVAEACETAGGRWCQDGYSWFCTAGFRRLVLELRVICDCSTRTCATYESKQHDNENSSSDNNTNNNDDNNK